MMRMHASFAPQVLALRSGMEAPKGTGTAAGRTWRGISATAAGAAAPALLPRTARTAGAARAGLGFPAAACVCYKAQSGLPQEN